jgi:hypothetical protein
MPPIPSLQVAALSVEHQRVAGLTLCGLIGVMAVFILMGQRREAVRRARGKVDGLGDPHYDPYADSPVPFEPDPVPCARCKSTVPDGARFCPGCGTEAAAAEGQAADRLG